VSEINEGRKQSVTEIRIMAATGVWCGMWVRHDPGPRRLLLLSVGAEEAELSPMPRRRGRRAGAGREQLAGHELLVVAVARRRRRRGVLVLVRTGRVAVAPDEDAELQHGRR
jgi:hypothetical protein